MALKKIVVGIIFLLLVGSFFLFDLGDYFNLEFIKGKHSDIQAYYEANPWRSLLLFFGLYVLVTALSLPGATVLTLVAGAIFGFTTGLILVSFASTLGATLAFLIARMMFKDWVQEKFGDRLSVINQGMEKEGAFYLFTLRLVPLFPFFVINLVMGLMPIKARTFMWVSQLGMLAGTMVFVNAGTQLASLESVSGIVSPPLLGSFILLGLFPLIAKKLVGVLQARRALSAWEKPQSFDRNLIVIGAGSGGLVTSYIAAAVKAKVSLVEKHKMGGDCLNTGCVPSKALIRTGRFLAQMKRAEEFGVNPVSADIDFKKVMARVHGVIKDIEPHDSVERYSKLGVDCIKGEAKITSPYSVEIDGRTLTTRGIVVATGARPFVPPIPGLDKMDYLTSDNLWSIDELPKRLLVLGGGPIGCELTQAFARLGSLVTQVEMLPRLLIREDPEVSEAVVTRFLDEGVDVRLAHKAVEFVQYGEQKELKCEYDGEEVIIPFDQILVAVGRKANTDGLDLDKVGVKLNPNGTISTDEFLQTDCPTIYACGDVVGPYQFTHTAAHQAWYAAVNALFGTFKRFKVDYSVIPHATFTDPEVGRVGLNELEAKEKGVEYEVTQYGLDDLDRAIAESEAEGFVKVLTVPGKDKILGATIVGDHAGELIGEFTSAMKHGYGMNKILGTIHVYPTMLEANKYAAGNWKRAHAPAGLLGWVQRFHIWRIS